MKILALVTLKPGASLDQVRSRLLDELRGSWSPYRSGVLREVYATESPAQIVFVLEADTAGAAASQVSVLPLVAAGAFDVKFIELRPFVNWSMLFSA
jgi:hypothetical protein